MACFTVSAEDEKRVKALGFLSNKGTDLFNGRVLTVNGKVTAEQLAWVAQAADKFGSGEVEMTTRLTLEVRGIPYEKIPAFIEFVGQKGLITGGTGAKVRPIVSCKGTTCQYGLIDTFALSEKIHHLFYLAYHDVTLPHKFKIAVGGCPNNCVKPNLNDVGIIGQRVPTIDLEKCRGCGKCAIEATCPVGAAKVQGGKCIIDTEICTHCGRCMNKCYFHASSHTEPGYKVYIGGRWGKQVQQGRALSALFFSEEEALKAAESALLLFRDQGRVGERFAQTIDRIGFENAERQIVSGELLARKDEILAKPLLPKA